MDRFIPDCLRMPSSRVPFRQRERSERQAVIRIIALLVFILPVVATGTARADLVGEPLVLDGDTMRVSGSEINLYGIHAPLITQSCGSSDNIWSCGWQAALFLEDEIAGREVSCELVSVADGEPQVARCSVEDIDLSAVMVEGGFAIPDEMNGQDYVKLAAEASEEKRGIWSGPFVDPVLLAEKSNCGCSARKAALAEKAAELKAQKAATE